MNIVILTTGDHLSGMGHIMRQIVLGKALYRARHDVSYLTRSDTPGYSMLDRELMWTRSFVAYRGDNPKFPNRMSFDICIIDIEHGPSRDLLSLAKSSCHKLVVVGGVGFQIHDQAAIDSLVDLQIYQSPVINFTSCSQTIAHNLVGLDHLILDESFLNARAAYILRQNEPINKKHILVSMGGADPHNLTWELSDALAKAFPAMQVVSVYGPAAKKATRRIISPNVTIIESPPPSQFAQLMSESCLIVTAIGMTVYEAMCVGVPIACTAWSEDHSETALHLYKKGALCYLNTWNKMDRGAMFAYAHTILSNSFFRNKETIIKHSLVDGLGTGRVVKALEELGR